jgi:hypothetical protein
MEAVEQSTDVVRAQHFIFVGTDDDKSTVAVEIAVREAQDPNLAMSLGRTSVGNSGATC